MLKQYIIVTLLTVSTILIPIKPFIILVGVFTLVDTIFAIYVNIKMYGIKVYRSNKLFNFAVKNLFYLGGILLAFLVDLFIFEGKILEIKLLITKTITLLFSYIEIKSIDEKSMKLGNKSFWKLLKEMINKGKEFKIDLGNLLDGDDKKDKDKEDEK